MQLVEVNVFTVQQPIESNMPISQDQGMVNNTESNLDSLAISYNDDQLANLNLWNGLFALTFLLGVEKFLSSDAQKITSFLLRIEIFIQQHFLNDKPAKNFLELIDIGVTTWYLINTIYESGQNRLIIDNNKSFCQCVSSYFVRNSMIVPNIPKSNSIINPVKLNKSKLTKLTYKKSYVQTSKINIEDIIYIKDLFPTLSPRKIKEISNIIHKSNIAKPKLKMTTKEPL